MTIVTMIRPPRAPKFDIETILAQAAMRRASQLHSDVLEAHSVVFEDVEDAQ